jgi:hypothetical protein
MGADPAPETLYSILEYQTLTEYNKVVISLWFSINMRDQVSHTCTATGKTAVLCSYISRLEMGKY